MIHICTECKNPFKSTPNSNGKYCSLKCCGAGNAKLAQKKQELRILSYLEHPNTCEQCYGNLEYSKRKNRFCNTSCAAKYNNSRKDYTKIRMGPKPKLKPTPLKSNIIEWPYTRIYLCNCKITGIKWYSPTIKTIHPSILTTKKLYSYQCRFTFSISQYKKWFDYASDLINQYGWYSAANRGNNLSGCSRDHLYSVTDGFINKINPEIIAHPANCKIVPHRLNQNKYKTSSITLDELLNRIVEFESIYGVSGRN